MAVYMIFRHLHDIALQLSLRLEFFVDIVYLAWVDICIPEFLTCSKEYER